MKTGIALEGPNEKIFLMDQKMITIFLKAAILGMIYDLKTIEHPESV